MTELAILAIAAFVQTTSFSLVSRARNRNHVGYHAVASVLSNGIWFATMGILITEGMTWITAIPYITGTVLGSIFGAGLAQRIEKWLGAKTE